LHRRFGRLPMRDLLAPTIRYAREGFPVSEVIAHYWARPHPEQRDQPGFRETFWPDGRPPQKGDIFRNAALAATLEQIAAGGRDAFYHGELADVMGAFFRRVGCALRKADLEAHAAEWVEPIGTDYRGYRVWELPPNTQGLAALQVLNVLEGFDLRGMGHNSVPCLHVMIEAKKLAFEDRARWYADPLFAELPVQRLLSKDYAGAQRARIDPKRAARRLASPASRAADARLREGDTVYLTVADRERTMVSLIQSNYRGFGSGLCPDGLGFCLQDRGALFALQETHPNVYAPAKRPFHTIIPGFVTRAGRPWLSFGVMGGDMQPQGHVQVLCNLIDFGMSLQEAGDAARWYHTGSSEPTGQVMLNGGVLALESGIPADVQHGLERLGHRIEKKIGPFGGYQAILYDEDHDLYVGASESRKDGQAAGY
jgi:gamma-glutamyltranspeptidase/glutathione hydrolase